MLAAAAFGSAAPPHPPSSAGPPSTVVASSSSSDSWSVPSLFSSKPHPLVIWHGLGDSAYADGLTELKQSLEEAIPGLFVHLIYLGEDASSDRKRGFFGNINEDIDQVCEQLQGIPELKGGMDAVGFSQGGQFLRGLVQRCPEVSIRNLVTFGSQHMGISDFPTCSSVDVICRLAEAALRGGVYSDYAQSHLISASYFRDPRQPESYARYLEANKFLADINNEVEQNDEYKKRLSALDTFVMLQFDKDVTVVPKRSGWFESYPQHDNNSDSSVLKKSPETIPLRQSELYSSNRLGLKDLDSRGSLVLDVCHGRHMQIDEECQRKVFGKYIGTPKSSAPRALRHAWAKTLYTVSGIRSTALPTAAHGMLFAATWLILMTSFKLGIALWIFTSPRIQKWRESKEHGAIRLP